MLFRITIALAALAVACSSTAQEIDWRKPEAIVEEALTRHPALASVKSRIDAAEERTRSAGAYPNPMVMGGVRDQQIDLTRDEMMTMYMVGASQTIPRSGRRQAARHSAGLDVDRLQLEARILRQEIGRDLLLTYYDVAAADSQIAATNELAAVVDSIVAAARSRYEVGTTAQSDLIRAQLQRTRIDHDLLILGGRRRVAAARLLAQLGLPPTTQIPALAIEHGTEAQTIDSPPIPPQDHPALEMIRIDIERREQDVALARLSSKPDWNVEVSYGARPTEKDTFSVVARVELPLRKNSVIEPQIRAAIAERDAATQRLEQVRRELSEALGIAYAQHDEATRQLLLHDRVLFPQAKLAFDATLAAYEAGRENIEAVLRTELEWLQLNLDHFNYVAMHIKSIADFKAIQRGARSGAASGMSAREAPVSRSESTGAMSSMR